ncbi:MAG: hypothetical protein K6E11_00935 [Bacilli bacterium]|nr:hypothetical protein [Bacilli bacterium]
MNNFTAAISSFLRFDVVVFNTLEYVMKKDSYDVNAYKARKEIINTEITQNTPLKSCLDNSGEAGEKLMAKIKELLDTVYSENSTIVKLNTEGTEVRVDSAQHIAVYEAVLPIHEEMRAIIAAHVNEARKQEKYDEAELDSLLEKEEYFYRGLTNMLLLNDLDHLFAEYNKARQEANGAITPQSNFIQNDLSKIVGFLSSLRQHSPLISADYYELIDPLFALIEMTNGRRALPEGKNFGDVITAVKTIARDKTMKWENAWKPAYDKYIQYFAEEAQKMQGAKASA